MTEPLPIGESFSVGRAFGNGFLAVRVATGPLWVGGLLMSISDCGGSVPGDIPALPGQEEEEGQLLRLLPAVLRSGFTSASAAPFDDPTFTAVLVGAIVAALIIGVLVGFGLFALNCWVTTGFVRLHVHVLERATDELAPLFTGKDRFWHMAGYKVVSGLSVSAATVVAAWPGALIAYYGYASDQKTALIAGIGFVLILALPVVLYFALGVFLGEHAVVLEGASPLRALRRSFELAAGNRLPLLGFGIVSVLVQLASLAGLLLCCVGALATVPLGRALTGFAKTESYLLFTRGHAQTADWRLWHRKAQEESPGPPLSPPAGPAPPAPPAAAPPP